MLPPEKPKKRRKEHTHTKSTDSLDSLLDDSTPSVQIETPEGYTVLPTENDLNSDVTEQDLRTLGVHLLAEFVDFHERCYK